MAAISPPIMRLNRIGAQHIIVEKAAEFASKRPSGPMNPMEVQASATIVPMGMTDELADFSPEAASFSRYGPKLAVGIGLLLALAGTLTLPDGAPIAGSGRRVWLPLPDWLLIAVVPALSIASLVVAKLP